MVIEPVIAFEHVAQVQATIPLAVVLGIVDTGMAAEEQVITKLVLGGAVKVVANAGGFLWLAYTAS